MLLGHRQELFSQSDDRRIDLNKATKSSTCTFETRMLTQPTNFRTLIWITRGPHAIPESPLYCEKIDGYLIWKLIQWRCTFVFIIENYLILKFNLLMMISCFSIKMTGKIIRPAPAEIEYRNMGRNMRFLITDQPQVLFASAVKYWFVGGLSVDYSLIPRALSE